MEKSRAEFTGQPDRSESEVLTRQKLADSMAEEALARNPARFVHAQAKFIPNNKPTDF